MMRFCLKSIAVLSFTVCTVLCFNTYCQAQTFSNDEAKRAYENASDALRKGDYDNAIMLYTQAIHLAPDNVMLRRDLAYTYFLADKKEKAKEVIDPVVNSDFADEQTYQVASAIENALGNASKAEKYINIGLKKFPQSGVLYNAKGNIAAAGKAKQSGKAAIEAWQTGINVEPTFPGNYFNAAQYYYKNNNPVWSLIYAEQYINLEPYSAKSVDLRKLMIDAYRAVFSGVASDKLPDFNKNNNTVNGAKESFAKVVQDILIKNGGVIASGLNTETLTMLRTRFILDWNTLYSSQFSSTLFTYQDKLLRSGNFDCYNQWLFGAISDSQEYGIWLKNNSQIFSKFENWKQNNLMLPTASDPRP